VNSECDALFTLRALALFVATYAAVFYGLRRYASATHARDDFCSR